MHFPRPNVPWLWLAAVSAITLSPLGAQSLPEGAGKEVVQKACSTCHPAALVIGRNMTHEQWSAEVTRMVGEGAKLTDAEFKQVVDYLAKAFPSGPSAAPPSPAAAAAPAGRGGGRGTRGGFGAAAPQPMQGPGRGGAAGGSGPADMQVIDSAAADRGRAVYIADCVTCHGPRARGASDGVP